MTAPLAQPATVLLSTHLDWLQPAQRRVAEAILADPEEAVQLSIGRLAELAGTSQATVVRLCRAIGLDGYPELRLLLAQEQVRRHHDGTRPRGDIEAGDDLSAVVAKIAAADAAAVQDTVADLPLERLAQVIDALAGASRIDVYGVGASGLVAADLMQKLLRIGRNAHAFTDAHNGLPSAALMRAGTAAVAISHTGTTRDTLGMFELAIERGAVGVAITNAPRSPIAQIAHHVLPTAARESSFRAGATASRLAQLAVVDCLFVGLAQCTFDASSAALQATAEAVRRH